MQEELNPGKNAVLNTDTLKMELESYQGHAYTMVVTKWIDSRILLTCISHASPFSPQSEACPVICLALVHAAVLMRRSMPGSKPSRGRTRLMEDRVEGPHADAPRQPLRDDAEAALPNLHEHAASGSLVGV